MSSPPDLRSITPLIPLPSSPPSSDTPLHPTPTNPRSKSPAQPYTRNHPHPSQNEENIDKFATLFEPTTPPASPTLEGANQSIFVPPIRPRRHMSYSSHHQPETPSSESDFGSFVSVAPDDDPLAQSSFSPLSPSTTTAFSIPTDSNLTSSVASSTSSPPSSARIHAHRPHLQNASLDFFDKFVEEAKKNSERNKKGVLDELLEHEDDPLYWLTAGSASAENGHVHWDESIGEKAEEVQSGQAVLVDLGPDAIPFDADPGDAANPEGEPERTSRHPIRSDSASYPQARRSLSHPRSPSLPGTIQQELADDGPLSLDTSSPARAKSYTSLGTLSSRWMSTLLSTSRPSPPSASPDTHRSLSTMFAEDPHVDAEASVRPSTSRSSLQASASLQASTSRQPTHHNTLPVSIPRSSHPPQHASTLSTPSTFALDRTISHGTPFASQIYTPPSGAPGFAGDREWDKGFSKDWNKDTADKKSVKLDGRKEFTTSVLTQGLADMIRSNLPALSRLPRSWTLLYSLDQHGISLNTLYTRCENQTPNIGESRGGGALVVVKDSGDAVFGAWMGEGVRLSKGAYYGSGESFLWKCVDDSLDIFRWTGKNDYVALCEPEYLSYGGGDGHYGLYLDDTLLEGSSARCPTFDNEPLCSTGPKKGGSVPFECVGLEVWSTGS